MKRSSQTVLLSINQSINRNSRRILCRPILLAQAALRAMCVKSGTQSRDGSWMGVVKRLKITKKSPGCFAPGRCRPITMTCQTRHHKICMGTVFTSSLTEVIRLGWFLSYLISNTGQGSEASRVCLWDKSIGSYSLQAKNTAVYSYVKSQN